MIEQNSKKMETKIAIDAKLIRKKSKSQIFKIKKQEENEKDQ